MMMNDPKKPVMVAVLCGSERSGWIAPGLMPRIAEAPMSLRRNVRVELIQGYAPVDAARNEAVRRLLASDCEWLVQIDNDTVPPSQFLSVIPQAEQSGGKFLIGLPCVLFYQGVLTFNVAKVMGKDAEGRTRYLTYNMLHRGWQTSDVVGGAVTIIHRKVFSHVSRPYFEPDPYYAARGRRVNEDYIFCTKAKAAGFDTWVNGDHPCQHFHNVDLLQLLCGMNQELDSYVKHLRSLVPGVALPTFMEFKASKPLQEDTEAPLTLPM